jgi:alpha,alpha-trehalose phosphorylase
MDLDDLTGSTAGGVHLATMGGLWQALTFGFGGVRPFGDVLRIDPHLPPQWNALELGLIFRGGRLRLRLDRDGVAASPAGWTVREHTTHWEVARR